MKPTPEQKAQILALPIFEGIPFDPFTDNWKGNNGESLMQIFYVHKIRRLWPDAVLYANPFSGSLINGRTEQQKKSHISKMKAEGWNPSDPDLTILYSNFSSSGYAFELKVSEGKAWKKRKTELIKSDHVESQAVRLHELSRQSFVSFFLEGALNTGLALHWAMNYGETTQMIQPITDSYTFEYQAGRYVPDMKTIILSKICDWVII